MTEENSYRIATAVFRFAASLGTTALARSFQEQAIVLLDRTVAEDYAAAARALRSIVYLTRFAGEVGMMSKEDAELLRKAADSHAPSLAMPKEKSAARLSLATLLPSQVVLPARNPAIRKGVPEKNNRSGNESGKESGNQAMRQNLPEAGEHERKKAILDRIRQSGNARLKEIQDALPHVSERTLRYALQRLVEEGRIERMGNGGAGSYYQAVSSAVSAPARV